MQRTSINPVDWGLQFSMDQGEIVEGTSKHLRCSGQVSVDPAPDTELGFAVVSPNDIRGQMQHSLRNVDAILEKAGMEKANIVALRFYTTDIDGFLANYDVYAEWIAPAGTRPPQSLLGVNRLVLPELMVEIEIEAAA
ncbi:MAG: RidA family protein [Gammaproteobacteria bacterium]|nr:RidA family protein [Gammaproteobacteria bacterium]NNC97082.1 RidA family protein [Gammaproteobacteria bacterium]NNM14069.1 RidA family protein [Gammaproteobacteria bacterium]